MIITKLEQVQSVLDFILVNDKLSFDTETNSLNTRLGQIIGFSVSNGVDSFYVVHQGWDGEKLVTIIPFEVCVSILQQLIGKKLICYNASFDIRFTQNYYKVDLVEALWADAMLAYHCVQEEGVPFSHRPFALKSVAAHLFGNQVKDEQDELKASIKANGGAANEFFKADTEVMGRYAKQDALLTYKLSELVMARVEAEGQTDWFLNQDTMPLLKYVVIPMEQKGIKLDLEKMISARKLISGKIADLEGIIQAAIQPYLADFEKYFLSKEYPAKRTGPFCQEAINLLEPDALPRTDRGAYSVTVKAIEALPEGLLKDWLQEKCYLPTDIVEKVQRRIHGEGYMFNLLSKFHLKRLMFDQLQEKALSFTPTGLPQADELFWESIRHKYAWVPQLIKFNKLNKIASTYMDRFLEVQEEGRFYPSYKLHGTVSGRLSGDFQQLPRPLEEKDEPDEDIRNFTNMIREFFVADEGGVFIDDDYDSAEPRIFAHISGEQGIKDIFAKGHDFYSSICLQVEKPAGVTADKTAPNYLGKVNKGLRQRAKIYALGIPYSMSGFKLQYEIDVPLPEAEKLVSNYLGAFPNLAAWMKDTYKKVYTEGVIKVETGRIRHLKRAPELYQKYGDAILDDLKLWKKYHEEPAIYAEAKKARREFKNLIANGCNVQVQGAVAGMINKSAIAIQKRFKLEQVNARIVGQLHDELLYWADLQSKDKAAIIIKECMEETVKFSVPMVAVPSFGQNFREAKG